MDTERTVSDSSNRSSYILRNGVIVILVIYSIISFFVARQFIYRLTPDITAYLQIAQRYAAGNFVIRGYWAPMISWLLALPVAFRMDPQIGQLFITYLVGLVWIPLFILWGKRFNLGPITILALLASVTVLVLEYAFIVFGPDMLGAVFLLIYLWLITDERFVTRPVAFGALTGAVGALAYYAKYYNLPFVLTHIFLSGVVLAIYSHQIRRVIVACGSALITLGLLVLPWLLLLFARYGSPTISTSGSINHAYVGPNSRGIHPCVETELCSDPPDVLFPWEDPLPKYYAQDTWSPFASLETFRYQASLMVHNFTYWLTVTLPGLGWLIPITLIAMVVFSFVAKSRRTRTLLRWGILTVLLYVLGYMTTYGYEFRYYYGIFPLLIIPLYYFIETLLARVTPHFSSQGVRFSLSALALIAPLISFTNRFAIAYLIAPHQWCTPQEAHEFEPYLKAPIAGTTTQVNYLAYYTQIRTYGATNSPNAEIVDTTLRETAVTTLVIPSQEKLKFSLTANFGYEEITTLPFCGQSYSVLAVP